ncbi:hypothetical protein HBI56_041910 [Parastagonospora nodorum]|nr:hypothetical protein HBH56_064830 [Parastagonospora nodorum]KAH3932546.1 hypothetical protein HBH54_083270 [Parastagonospora nodorum]KAH3955117.1 hypothetical protein HBH53_011130 [Parastagonospora nodorum]KAH3986529.1 hypothetical protein HBH52_042330 [Parastagonospora nodorum]KAH3988028.1 hypothetical protein HBH51_006710 [Parastagonospora nodorum]
MISQDRGPSTKQILHWTRIDSVPRFPPIPTDWISNHNPHPARTSPGVSRVEAFGIVDMTTPPSPTTTFHKEPSPAAVHMGNTDSGNSPWQPNAPFVTNACTCGVICCTSLYDQVPMSIS